MVTVTVLVIEGRVTVCYLQSLTPHLRIVLNEEQEHYILPEVLDGQVERMVCVRFEHLVQQRCCQLSKITSIEVSLQHVNIIVRNTTQTNVCS